MGSLVRVPFGARKVRGVVVELHEAHREGLESISGLVTAAPVAPGELGEVYRAMARRHATTLASCFERAVPPRVRLKVPAIPKLAAGDDSGPLDGYDEGSRLLEEIAAGRGSTWVVRCVPGEDRGAIARQLVAASLRVGRPALVAAPEVSFGSLALDSLSARWPEIARVDSTAGDRERSRGWLALGAGHPLGFGGRAAVLAPAIAPGAIVVTEESNVALKDDRSPRFDARRVASDRAHLAAGTAVLLSATPSVEFFHIARSKGGVVEPSRHLESRARPIVELVDSPEDRAIAHLLHRRVATALDAGERVALLVPARGYARALWCSECHRSLRCPRCESGLFFDRERSSVACGRCGFEAPAPEACPTCGASRWRYIGVGSDRLAEQVGKAFPRARVARMDPEVLATSGGSVAEDEVDIYVTTWIGTKPEIRPPVSLVGVLGADSLLRRPDWRAAESAYQALAAMAEWAGPRSTGGRLVIQTAEPVHYAVQSVVRGDYAHFFENELEVRRELGYPPFQQLIRATAFGPRRAGLIERCAGAARSAGARVLGPVEVVPDVHEGADSAVEVLIKCDAAEPIADELRVILASVPAGNRLRVDVDPR